MVLSAACAEDGSGRGAEYPSGRLHWTIAFGAGGGNDRLARTLIDILQRYELYPGQIVAQNRPAGAGALGWGYVHAQAGNPYHISTTSGSFISTPLVARTDWGPLDFTPVALLATDDVLLVVHQRSPVHTLQEFIDAARSRPPAIGGMGQTQIDYLVPHLLAREAGFRFRYVPFNSEGELAAALLSRSLEAITVNPAAVIGLLEAGEVRALAFSGPRRFEAFGDVPTLREAGFESIDLSMPRGLVLPPGVPADAQRWWIEAMRKVVETPEWRAYVDASFLSEDVRYGDDFRVYLAETSAVFESLLRELGTIP